ncbi:MAG: universal stress protein [Ardenticatenaceae bacterium]|nr:universal stress protein [Ardenticatenaceae bacterium]
MTEHESFSYTTALQDFKRARQQASMRQLMARITGKSTDLLAYKEIEKLHVLGTEEGGVQEIPLDRIVGSVGRYKDFTRDFLPKRASDAERWARVKAAIIDMRGMPPIEVYQIGEVYFVKDGNHRVSVARQLGTETISAYVTKVETRVSLTADDDPTEVICKARYVEFLEATNLDELRPEANLLLTFCNHFPWFLRQIKAHQQEIGDMEWETAVADWYDNNYLPVIQLMREMGVQRNFPRRTEADLYYLVSEHREEMEEALGWEVETDDVATHLAGQEQARRRHFISRLARKLLHIVVPPELEEGPAPGQWRQQQLAAGRQDRLFEDFLVALSGEKTDWRVLDQVVRLAQWENDRILGLHVVSDPDKVDNPHVQLIREHFEAVCAEAGLVGEFAVEVGEVADTIIKRAAWADLVVTSLTHPPGPQPLERLSHGFNRLVQQCPRPIMAIPTGANSDFNRVLLSYDGSPKADEALFVATYLKARWPISLVVLTVETEYTPPSALDKARSYIEQYGIKHVEYVLRQKPIAEAVLETAVDYNINEIIMGGFGFRPVKHLILGSTVDTILREFKQPVLICR